MSSGATALKNTLVTVTVEVASGPHKGEKFQLQKFPATIGRGAENAIVLMNDPKLSRIHIRIDCQQDLVSVENLSSKNPLLFKGNYETKIEIKPADFVEIGDSRLAFQWDAPTGERTVAASSETLMELISEKTMVQVPPPQVQGTPALNVQGTPVPNVQVALAPSAQPRQPQAAFSPSPVGSPVAVDFKGLSGPRSAGLPEPNYGSRNPSQLIQRPAGKQNQSNPRNQRTPSKNKPGNGLVPALAVVLIIGLGLIFLSDRGGKSNKPTPIKDKSVITSELNKDADAVQQYVKEKHLDENGRIDRQYESAQSYYVKGFRDYRQGQYSRAMSSFQAALSFDPNHALSKQYLNLSIRKYSELIQFNLDQARNYRQNNNYRLCKSAAQQVMVLRRDQNDPQYKDAKALFDQCDTLAKGRF